MSVVDEKTGALEKVQVTPRTQAGQVRPETIAGTAVLPVASPSPTGSGGSFFPANGSAAASYPATNGKPLMYAVKALHKFAATQADGLSFAKAEIISIVDRKDGWLRGVNAEGKEGWVPSNYVQTIEGSAPDGSNGAAPSQPASARVDGEPDPTARPKTLAVDTSSAASSSPTNDITQPSPRPDVPALDPNMTPRVDQPTPRAPELPTDAYVATPRASVGGTETPEEEYRDKVGDLLITPRMAQSIGQATEKVRAQFNFDAKKPDHLSFKKGDIMIVIKKKAGWWKVHHEGFSGKLGYVEKKYVFASVRSLGCVLLSFMVTRCTFLSPGTFLPIT